MADICQDLRDDAESAKFQIEEKSNEMQGLIAESNGVSADSARLKVLASDIVDGSSYIRITLRELTSVVEKLRANNCRGISTYEDTINRFQGASTTFAQKADAIFQKAEALALQEQEASAAAQKRDNSGNGTPGSAGSNDGLEEVKVTGVKKPETISSNTDPGAKSGSDGLEEVTVTGKKSPDTLEEVKVTGKLNPNELQEVTPTSTKRALPSETQAARSQAAQSDAVNWALKGDWRVRLGLAPGANYLYKAPDVKESILAPLAATDGIVFPYTPIINVSYLANYDSTAVQHSNYKVYQYQNSAVEQVSITCDFTAQSTQEANYVLAVIHFLRSVTKMFYGRDQNPIRGTPPPLCYLTGLGQYQFNAHPLLISGFTYNLPNDVDYIRAVMPASFGPTGNSVGDTPKATGGTNQQSRIGQGNPGQAGPGGNPNPAALSPNGSPGSTQPTYVPTKINIQISAYPVVSRAVASNDFSFKQYATGSLLLGKNNSSGGGIW